MNAKGAKVREGNPYFKNILIIHHLMQIIINKNKELHTIFDHAFRDCVSDRQFSGSIFLRVTSRTFASFAFIAFNRC